MMDPVTYRATLGRCVRAFVASLDRAPTDHEFELIVGALDRYATQRQPSARGAMPASIVHVDTVLCEDDRTVLFSGYTNGERIYIASLTLPTAIDRRTFRPPLFRSAMSSLEWRVAT